MNIINLIMKPVLWLEDFPSWSICFSILFCAPQNSWHSATSNHPPPKITEKYIAESSAPVYHSKCAYLLTTPKTDTHRPSLFDYTCYQQSARNSISGEPPMPCVLRTRRSHSLYCLRCFVRATTKGETKTAKHFNSIAALLVRCQTSRPVFGFNVHVADRPI